MRKKGLFAAFALALGLLVGAAVAGESAWLTSFDEAVSTAKKEKKVVLADFTGSDWCIWCKRLKGEIFDTEEFKEWAAKRAILLELDFPKKKEQDPETKKKNRELANKYNVKGFPTVIFFDGEGNEVGRTGYVKGGPKAWIEKAEAVLAKK